MQLKEIYHNSHTILTKDGNSGLISLEKFNYLLPPVQYELIRKESALNEVRLQNGNEALLSLGILQDLIIRKDSLSLAGGVAILSLAALGGNFLYWGTMNTTGAYSGARRKIKLVTQAEFQNMFSNMMSMNIDENPVAYLYSEGGNYYAKVYPDNLSTADFVFIKKPTNPFLDYYMDANYKTQFMDVTTGGDHTLITGEQYRDGTTYQGTAADDKESQTKELEIPEDYHQKFQDLLIQRMSLPIDEQYVNQFALAKEQQS